MELQFFAVIHEFAVIGTTFFMLALATLWYSPLMFGSVWVRVSKSTGVVFDEGARNFWTQLIGTFVAYLVQVSLLAWAIAYVQSAAIAPWLLQGSLALFVMALTIPPVIFEERPLAYYAIHTGFMVVFIGVSGALVTYWPW